MLLGESERDDRLLSTSVKELRLSEDVKEKNEMLKIECCLKQAKWGEVGSFYQSLNFRFVCYIE